MAKDLAEKQVKQLGVAFNCYKQSIKQLAYKVLIRARLQYQMVPLIAAGLISVDEVVK